MKRSDTVFGLARIPLDFAMVVVGFLLGYRLRLQGDFVPGHQFDLNPEQLMPLMDYLQFSLIFAGMLVAVFAIFGLYNLKNTTSLLHELRRVFSHSIIWVLVMMAFFFVIGETFFSRLAFGFSAVIALALVMGARILLGEIRHFLFHRGIGQQRVMLVGSNKITRMLGEQLDKDPRYKLCGFIGGKAIKGIKKLGSIKDFQKVVKKYKIDELVLTRQDLPELQDHDILEFCQLNHIDYRFVPDILELERSNVEIETLAGLPLIHLKPTSLDGWGKVVKRSIDLLGSGLGLLLLSPIFLLIGVIIKLDSPGPIFFTKKDDGKPAYRVGQKGRKFVCYKFRTMKHKTDSMREKLKHKSHRKGPLMKIKGDPRVTRFGRLLRRTSIDELPQLWNVFKGQMSLVGPRPHLPEEVEQYEKHHHFLLTIKPGITGLSQISGRSDLDFEEEVRLDTTYIRQWSLFLDFKILIKTLIVVSHGKGAD